MENSKRGGLLMTNLIVHLFLKQTEKPEPPNG